jgi:hypothetical protein
LSKSLNRGFATLLAGALGLGAQHLASLSGEKGQPIVLGILVFLLGMLLIHVQTKALLVKTICINPSHSGYCMQLQHLHSHDFSRESKLDMTMES